MRPEAAGFCWRSRGNQCPFQRAVPRDTDFDTRNLTLSVVMTDHAKVFQSKRFQRALRQLGIRHRATPPYTPRVNGKVERFIRTLLNEWACAHAYPSSEARDACLHQWLHYCNWHRPHTSLGNQAPVSRLELSVNNVVRLHK